NLAYLLGRISTGNEALKDRAVASLEPWLNPKQVRVLNLQVVPALGFIATDGAADLLKKKLAEFERDFATNKQSAEICHKVVSTPLPARHVVAIEPRRVKDTPAPPLLLAQDRTLHRLRSTKDLAQSLCHAFDAGATGRLEVSTHEGAVAEIRLQEGHVRSASV